MDNGLNPVWNELCDFDILNPEVAMIRFVVQDEDVFGDPAFLGQATIPVKCLRTGWSFSMSFSELFHIFQCTECWPL